MNFHLNIPQLIEYRFHLLERGESTQGVPEGNFSGYWLKNAGTQPFLYILIMKQEVFFLAILLHIRYLHYFAVISCW